MPRVDGIGALREIKKRKPGVPVLLVSAVGESEATKDWELADGHVRKPIDFVDLLARVDLLTGGPPLPGSPSP
jgi:DNA-binding response OmpR family regulator